MTNPAHTPTAADCLKYAAARLTSCTDWATDSIAGSLCDNADDGHALECDAINDIAREIYELSAQFGDPGLYSDGRRVVASAEVESGVIARHIWHPDSTAEEPTSWRGNLRHDPDEPCPGLYEVTTDPLAQSIHVRVVRVA